MKYKYSLYTLLGLSLMSGLSACKKDFLEVTPFGLQVTTTTDDYDKLMNDPAFYYIDNQGWQETVYMGDEVAADAGYLNQAPAAMSLLFQWAADIYPSTASTLPMIDGTLEQLYTVNKIINEVSDSKGGTTEQKNALRAEALATRALYYFQMANYYTKPYNAATAASDPGFPIVDKSDVNVKVFARGTVQQTYEFIIKDLQEAITSLPQKPRIVTRWSKSAAEAFLGKVLLFMSKPADALPHLNNAFTQLTANGAPKLYDYNVEFATGGAFLPIDPTFGPSGPGNNRNDLKESLISKVFYNGPVSGNYSAPGNDGLVLSKQAESLYGATDLRVLLYTKNNQAGTANPNGTLRKYGVTYSRFGVQLPELYLLLAECKARLNDLAGAKVDLEMLRKNRMPAADATVPSAIASNQTALIRFAIEERIREFACEGYRWFDMRRLSVDPLFSGQVFNHISYDANGGSIVYTLNQPNRLVLRFPSKFILRNPGMSDNP